MKLKTKPQVSLMKQSCNRLHPSPESPASASIKNDLSDKTTSTCYVKFCLEESPASILKESELSQVVATNWVTLARIPKNCMSVDRSGPGPEGVTCDSDSYLIIGVCFEGMRCD